MARLRGAAPLGVFELTRRADHRVRISSPLGEVVMSSDGTALTGLRFAGDGDPLGRPKSAACLDVATALLARYWAGERISFNLPLSLRGTPFQRDVWAALLEVPYGDTVTYAELARRIGAPRAVRAVGRANGSNPIAIVVPCHRVIGSNGTLAGYGGGLERKRALLELEGAL